MIKKAQIKCNHFTKEIENIIFQILLQKVQTKLYILLASMRLTELTSEPLIGLC